MGIFDRFKGQSGNQTEEEQQDASQPTGGQFSDQSGQGGMQTAQNTIGQQGGARIPAWAATRTRTRISTGTRTRASKPASTT
jgi:hypothetical protein